MYTRRMALSCICLYVLFAASLAQAETRSARFSIVHGGLVSEMDCLVSDRGILLVPVNDFALLVGYRSTVCDPCGDNELEALDQSKAKAEGLILVKWGELKALRSAKARHPIRLRVPVERCNGITYADVVLFEALGCAIRVDLSQHTLTLTPPSI